MNKCNLQLTPEKTARTQDRLTHPEVQRFLRAHFIDTARDLNSTGLLTQEQLEEAIRTVALRDQYKFGKPPHGVLRNITAVRLLIDQALTVYGADVVWESQIDLDKRVFEYAQQCYLTGKTHVIGGNPCGEIELHTGKPAKSSWLWPNEFMPRQDSAPTAMDAFGFGLGKVVQVVNDHDEL